MAKSSKSRETGKTVTTASLARFLDQTLNPSAFSDYCPNGLQVEGKSRVAKLVSGVTASARFIDAASQAGADAVLVHHGYFWRGEDQRITGMKRDRIASLLASNINLFAYHLPLDAHEALGNNVQLAEQLGFQVNGRCGSDNLVFYSDLDKPMSIDSVARRINTRLKRKPTYVGPRSKQVRRIAWCTGGAQDYIDAALLVGADVFISGEISERTTHIARECSIGYFGAGHHATERYGVQAVGRAAAEALGIDHEFIDDPNPV